MGSDDDYEGAHLRGLADAELILLAVQWLDAVRNVPDAELTPEMRGYRDGLREGLGA
jgi:hypothetical protein